MVDKFFKEIHKFIDEPDAYNKFRNLVDEYNTKYTETKESQIVWSRNLEMDLHWSFKKHGQLNIPVLDRPYRWFEGSSHTFFHACYLKWDSLKIEQIKTQKNSLQLIQHQPVKILKKY